MKSIRQKSTHLALKLKVEVSFHHWNARPSLSLLCCELDNVKKSTFKIQKSNTKCL